MAGEKAVYRLLQIWEKIYRQLSDWKLVIVGDGETREENENLTKFLGLENVEFLGSQKSIPIIDESSILCLTSNIEGQPTVFMEAMTLGVVPIGFDSFSAIYEMIDNGMNGIIIPAFDLNQYAEALRQLAFDSERRFCLAMNAQTKVRQFDMSVVSEMWVHLFKELKLL